MAGKTVLSSYIVDKIRDFNIFNCLFAFLNYKDPTITVIKIYQSFIFQILLENPHLQPVISAEYQVNPRKISSDSKHVRTLLLDLLKAVDTTYIVIDGLDEIHQTERQYILRELLEVNQDSSNTKLLLSSRIEPDIVRLLPKNVGTERIDDRNMDDIQGYVQIRTNEWLMSSDFDAETCDEIRKLLVPLPRKSGGMFCIENLGQASVGSNAGRYDAVCEISDRKSLLPWQSRMCC